MKITKFAQSCIMIESKGKKILIDPGSLKSDEEIIQKWMHPDFILVTHKHYDHFDENAVSKIITNKTIIYATSETAKEYPNTKFEIVKERDEFNLGEVKAEAVKAVHGGGAVKEEVGYILAIEGKKLYHTGDTVSFTNNYNCNIICLPFNNKGFFLSPTEAALFAKSTGAETVIPIHFDNPDLPADKSKLKFELEKNKIKCKFLEIGESIEI